MDHTTIFPCYWTDAKIFCIPSSSSRPPNQLAFNISSLSYSLITRPDKSRVEDSTPGLKFFFSLSKCYVISLAFLNSWAMVSPLQTLNTWFGNSRILASFSYSVTFIVFVRGVKYWRCHDSPAHVLRDSIYSRTFSRALKSARTAGSQRQLNTDRIYTLLFAIGKEAPITYWNTPRVQTVKQFNSSRSKFIQSPSFVVTLTSP